MRLILIALLIATPAAAQDLFPRFSVTHGFYRTRFDTYSGSALSGTAAIEYLLARRLRLGLAWNYFSLDGRVDDQQFGGELGLTMSGAEAFVRVAF